MNPAQEDRHDPDHHPHRGKWALFGFFLVAAYFLFTEHQAHVLGALPYLLLLACPLMHVFHHRGGHHHHRARGSDGANETASATDAHRHGKDAS